MSAFTSIFPLNVDIPETSNLLTSNWLVDTPAVAVTVTEPPEIADTLKLSPKLIVPAVPTIEPLFLIAIPDPEPETPVSPEPSPINLSDESAPVLGL